MDDRWISCQLEQLVREFEHHPSRKFIHPRGPMTRLGWCFLGEWTATRLAQFGAGVCSQGRDRVDSRVWSLESSLLTSCQSRRCRILVRAVGPSSCCGARLGIWQVT